MQIIKAEIPDVLIIKPDIFQDERGYFYESYNINTFQKAGLDLSFMQDNESKSRRDVIRGIHFQNPPYEQGKLVRVIKGSVKDVAVDIRKNSPYFGKWCSAVLSEDNKLMMWIPPGFAHGFVALEEETIFFYKCTQVYHKDSERSIRWDDPDLNIDWGLNNPMVNSKDQQAPLFRNITSPFTY